MKEPLLSLERCQELVKLLTMDGTPIHVDLDVDQAGLCIAAVITTNTTAKINEHTKEWANRAARRLQQQRPLYVRHAWAFISCMQFCYRNPRLDSEFLTYIRTTSKLLEDQLIPLFPDVDKFIAMGWDTDYDVLK